MYEIFIGGPYPNRPGMPISDRLEKRLPYCTSGFQQVYERSGYKEQGCVKPVRRYVCERDISMEVCITTAMRGGDTSHIA
jgi:hypothetical protein